jgi:O-antigen ligase
VSEHIGILGTTSTAGRVRYRGVLQDPNETSLAVGSALPVAFAMREDRSTIFRTMLLVVSIIVISICVIYTQSRGGQLVIAAVLGTYFVKKYGLKGAILGGVMWAPLMLLGGRDDSKEGSADERVELMIEGLQFVRQYPFLGVGWNQFSEYCSFGLTAHNSYLLAISELGPIGFFLFTAVLYLSFKTLLMGMKRYRDVPEARIARVWSTGLLAALIGACLGSFFLSFTYHNVLWIFIGLTGAFWSAAHRHDPDFKVNLTFRDGVYCCLIDVGIFVALNIFVKTKH